MKAITFAVLACALVSGCATGPSMSDPKTAVAGQDPGKARIYFYRTGIVGGAYQPEVTLNGVVVGKAVPRGVSFKDVPPGAYAVTTSMTKDVVRFDIAAGQRRYVRFNYSFGFQVGPELVDAALGEQESRELSYVADASPAAPRAASPAPAAGVAQAGPARDYRGSMRCGSYEGAARIDNPGPWVASVRVTVRGAQATLQRGDGQYTESLAGRVEGNSMTLEGRGAMLATPNAYWVTRVSGQFASGSSRFDGTAQVADSKGQVLRRCTVDLGLGAG